MPEKQNKNKSSKQKTLKYKSKKVNSFDLEKRKWPLLIAILLLTFGVMSPTLHNGFTNWDDGLYVLNNPVITNLSFDNLKTMFTEKVVDNYFPFTMLSLAFNYSLSAFHPHTYHFLNLLLHLLNTFLVFWLAYRLSNKSTLIGGVTAVLFGIHPMHVESVAWIAERKDVLYGAFFLGGLLTYWRYLDGLKWKWLELTGLLFLGSLWSKPAAVVFPLVLLLMDYFRQRDIDRRVIWEKIPFFMLSLLFAWITISIQKDAAIVADYTLWQRVCFASYGFLAYLFKAFIPVNLSALYPYPISNSAEGLPLLFQIMPLLALGVLGLIGYFFRQSKYVLFGMLFFIINIVLILQFVAVGNAIIADRYTYLSYIGLFFIFSMLLEKSINNFEKNKYLLQIKKPLIGLFLVAIVAFSMMSFQRAKVWKNSNTLWSDVIEKYPDHPLAYMKRGEYFYGQKNYPKALNDYSKAIAANRGYAPAYASRALMYFKLKDFQKALVDYDKSLRINDKNAVAYNGRGHVYYELKDFEKALADYDRSLALNPNYHLPYNNKAIIYHLNGDTEKALEYYNKALKINPTYLPAIQNRGVLLRSQGN